MGATTAPSLLWFVARASGVVAYVQLMAIVVLGIALSRRWHRAAWPRLLVEATHRWLTLLFFLFIAVHSVTVLLDPFTHFGLNDILIPFGSAYRTIWLGLGVLAAELALAIALSAVVRRWIGYRMWHALHMLTYVLFPLSLLHGLGTGTDTTTPWATIMYGGSVLAVGAMVLWRTARRGAVRPWVLAGLVLATVALVAWVVGGPAAPSWSVAAGTPPALLRTAAQ